jgi:hypothetical protein
VEIRGDLPTASLLPCSPRKGRSHGVQKAKRHQLTGMRTQRKSGQNPKMQIPGGAKEGARTWVGRGRAVTARAEAGKSLAYRRGGPPPRGPPPRPPPARRGPRIGVARVPSCTRSARLGSPLRFASPPPPSLLASYPLLPCRAESPPD